MIALLSCFMSLSADDDVFISPTGELVTASDSVMIAFDDLRIVNSKLIQLEYEQQINERYKNIIENDKIAIEQYKLLNDRINQDYKKVVRQRNIAIGGCAAIIVIATTLLLVK